MPKVALVGRPNVGKSILFNRLSGRKQAIVEETSGVTRDLLYAEIAHDGTSFQLIDTGGLVTSPDALEENITRQTERAVEEAELLLFVVSAQEGRTPLDDMVAKKLRASGKEVWLVVNKADNEKLKAAWSDFCAYGFSPTVTVSAMHAIGTEELLDRLLVWSQKFSSENTEENFKGGEPYCAIAFVGKPNAGKSSLLNALAGYERSIVSSIPGTTRDAVDTEIAWEIKNAEGEINEQKIRLVDTAGIRRKRAIDSKLEAFSVARAEGAIRRSNVCVLLVDATAGISVTDKKIAAIIAEAGRPCIIGINKWDLMQGKTDRTAYIGWLRQELPFLEHAPVVLLSALKGRNIKPLIDGALKLYAASSKKISTGILNRAVRDAMERRSPASQNGRRLKFFYATQKGSEPPTFLLFVNNPDFVSASYTAYLKKSLRTSLELTGAPIVLEFKARESRFSD